MLAQLSSHITPSWFQYLLPIELPSPQIEAPADDDAPPRKLATPGACLRFGFGALSAICRPELVDQVLAECDRRERRRRLLPAQLTVYALLLMCLHPTLGYQRLMHQLAEAAPAREAWPIPNKSSFVRARARLGEEVMEKLFRALARPLADDRAQGCFWRGHRVMAMDGSTIELADNAELETAFGGPTTKGGRRSGPPLARLTGLVECGTRALVDVAIGGYRESEKQLVARLLPSMTPGMLLLADRNFPGVRLWKQCAGAGADLLWRARDPIANRVLRHLCDGSYLAQLGTGKRALCVRVIEYTLEGSDTVYRLLTNLLDPNLAPASELAKLYAERWEIEIGYGELKTVQAASQALRSKTVAGVLQEFWAHCVLHQLSRQLAYQAAMQTPERDCDRISFTALQDALRRGVRMATGSPRCIAAALRNAIGALIAERALLTRRDRACPRIARDRRSRYPGRGTYSGPLTIKSPRRPEIIVCA